MSSGHTVCPYKRKQLKDGLPKNLKFSVQVPLKVKESAKVGIPRPLTWPGSGAITVASVFPTYRNCDYLAEKEQKMISVLRLGVFPLDSSTTDLHFLHLTSV